MKRKILLGLAALIGLLIILGLVFKDKFERLQMVGTLFTGVEQHQRFARIKEIFPVTTMPASSKPFDFPSGEPVPLPLQFQFQGNTVNSQDFLATTGTSALLVIKDGKVRYENYWLTGGRDVQWLSMSVAKSFIATGIGIAVDEGLIDIQKPITDYVPELKGSAYDQVRVKDVLQMSSGAAWNEDYSDSESDVLRLGKIMAVGGSLDEFVPGLKRENKPGTVNHYNSADTQALGMLLSRATKRSITAYLNEKLWQPLGMENPGYWMVDDHKVEMAFGGLNATARDYAKLGELHRLMGQWQGKQIVSADWVKAASRFDAPHLRPGLHPEFPLGYGYQWWIPETAEGEYSAIGVYNQFIFINPKRGTVIVKLSANPSYGTTSGEESNRELETIEFFRAINQAF